MKLTVLCALSFFASYTLFAEDASKVLANDLVKHWQVSKELSLAVAQAMPEDGYSFKPPHSERGIR